MTLSLFISFFLQIGIFSQPNPDNRIYLKLEHPDTSKTTFSLFQGQNQQAPYISSRDSLLTLRIKNIIDGNYYTTRSQQQPLGTFPVFDIKKFDKYGVLELVDFQNARNEIKTKNFDFAYNVLSGKADFGVKLINKKDLDLKFGMNLSFDYLQLNKLQEIKVFGSQLIYDPDRYSGNNQFFVSYRIEKLEILSKYELPIFNQHEHQFNEDKISIVIAWDF